MPGVVRLISLCVAFKGKKIHQQLAQRSKGFRLRTQTFCQFSSVNMFHSTSAVCRMETGLVQEEGDPVSTLY